MTPDLATYTVPELDQLAGALLYVGGLNHTLGHVLDVTRDPEITELFEWINHMPVQPAIDMLSTLSMAITEVRARLEVMGRAVDAASDSTAARIVADEQDLTAAFDTLMNSVFGDRAKKDGLS